MFAHSGLLLLSFGCAGLFDHAAWWCLCAAVSGFSAVQIGFLGHDLEHGQVPMPMRWRSLAGLLCWNFLLGVSSTWWREKHRRHHRQTHVSGADPDLYALFAYDLETARTLAGPHRWFVVCQAWLFWPVTAFARLYFHGLSMVFTLRLPWRQRLTEVFSLCMHHALAWTAAWAVLGNSAPWFMAISQMVSGLYMGLAFSTNHLGMPLAQQRTAGKQWQVQHTRNIRTNALGTYLLGGLNLQIEHHLHPALDRSALRALQPCTERDCRQAGIPYHQTGLIDALGEVQASLHRVAIGARKQ